MDDIGEGLREETQNCQHLVGIKGESGWTGAPQRTGTGHIHISPWRSVILKAFQKYEERDELVDHQPCT